MRRKRAPPPRRAGPRTPRRHPGRHRRTSCACARVAEIEGAMGLSDPPLCTSEGRSLPTRKGHGGLRMRLSSSGQCYTPPDPRHAERPRLQAGAAQVQAGEGQTRGSHPDGEDRKSSSEVDTEAVGEGGVALSVCCSARRRSEASRSDACRARAIRVSPCTSDTRRRSLHLEPSAQLSIEPRVLGGSRVGAKGAGATAARSCTPAQGPQPRPRHLGAPAKDGSTERRVLSALAASGQRRSWSLGLYAELGVHCLEHPRLRGKT